MRGRSSACGAAFAASGIAFIVLILALAPLISAQGRDVPTEGSGTRVLLVLVGEEPDHTTVWHRVAVQDADRDERVVQVAVPLDAERHDVVDAEGRPLAWTLTRPGVLNVGLGNDTQAAQVTSRGAEGPAPGIPLRFGDDPATGTVVLVVTMPASRQGAPEGLQATDRDTLNAAIPFAAAWPVPSDARVYWNTGADTSVPSRLEIQTPREPFAVAPYAAAAGVGILLAALTVWLVARIHSGVDDPTRPRRQPIMTHLDELRRRLTILLMVLVAAMTFFFTFGFRWVTFVGLSVPLPWPSLYSNAAAQVFDAVSRRIVPPGVDLVVVNPWDAVVTLILVSVAMALIAVFPVFFYHIYAFLAPALYPRERRVVLSLVPLVIVLLVLGASFGLAVMAPLMARVLYGFALGVGATAFITMSQLVGLAALMSVVFGISFQLPLVMMATARMGLVRARWYREKWRHAVIVIAIVAAFVTDPTILTQIIVGVVLFALYGIGILLAMLVDREREPRDG